MKNVAALILCFLISVLAAEEKAEPDLRAGSAQDTYYRVETIPVPAQVNLEVGGLAFIGDGKLAIATRTGDVWTLSREGKWTRFASGLQDVLGLWPGRPGEVFVVQRPELTRLKDDDGDGKADLYETVTAGWGVSGDYHEFSYGLVRDGEGNFWGTLGLADDGPNNLGSEMASPTAYRGWSFKLTPRGEFIPWSVGFRQPNGIGMNLQGELFVTDNEGGWVAPSKLHHVTRGAFHGHPAGLIWDRSFDQGLLAPLLKPPYAWGHDNVSTRFKDNRSIEPIIAELDRRRKPAAILFPYGVMGHSPSQPLCDSTVGRFGPFSGQIFVADHTQPILMRVALEKVRGEYQGALFPFYTGPDLRGGNNRLAFAPDGSLYIGQTYRGFWAVRGGEGLQRVSWTGRLPMEIHGMSLTRDGFDLTFTKPVDPSTASDPARYFFQHYYYSYRPQKVREQTDKTPVAVQAVRVSADRRRATIVLGQLLPSRIYELHIKGLEAADGSPLLHPVAYYTLSRLQE